MEPGHVTDDNYGQLVYLEYVEEGEGWGRQKEGGRGREGEREGERERRKGRESEGVKGRNS